MARGSNRYAQLKARLGDLRRSLLSFVPEPAVSATSYTPQEVDSTRAYIVLAHAEIEAFCEDIIRNKVDAAKHAYDRHGRVSPVMRKLVSYYVVRKGRSWSDTKAPSTELVNSAAQSHMSALRDNHGIKQSNLEKLLYPVGVLQTQLNATFLAQMDSFGTNRGRHAHSSTTTTSAPDPVTEITTVNQILIGLLDLDRLLGNFR